jgi:hypothetical protein
MIKNNTLVVAILSTIFAAPLGATEVARVTIPAEGFEMGVAQALGQFKPKDAFAVSAACGVVDAKTFRAYSLSEAVSVLKPCLREVSLSYKVKAVARVEASENQIVILLDGADAIRDFNHALSLRHGQLLGHPAKVKRAFSHADFRALQNPEAEVAHSSIQDVVDTCMISTVVRKVQNGDDFIKIYGRCILSSKDLKVQELRSSNGHTLAVNVLTKANQDVVEALNGTVTVNAGTGPVDVLIIAYPETLQLP